MKPRHQNGSIRTVITLFVAVIVDSSFQKCNHWRNFSLQWGIFSHFANNNHILSCFIFCLMFRVSCLLHCSLFRTRFADGGRQTTPLINQLYPTKRVYPSQFSHLLVDVLWGHVFVIRCKINILPGDDLAFVVVNQKYRRRVYAGTLNENVESAYLLRLVKCFVDMFVSLPLSERNFLMRRRFAG